MVHRIGGGLAGGTRSSASPISSAAIWLPPPLRVAMQNGRSSSTLSTCLRRTAGSSPPDSTSTMVCATTTCSRCTAITESLRLSSGTYRQRRSCLPGQSNQPDLSQRLDELQPTHWIQLSPCMSARAPCSAAASVCSSIRPNANPFLDNRPGNNAPNGLEGNPGGPDPVYTVAALLQAGVPGSIFPGHSIMPTGTVSAIRRIPAVSSLSTATSAPLTTSTTTSNWSSRSAPSVVPDWLRRQRRPPAAEPAEHQSTVPRWADHDVTYRSAVYPELLERPFLLLSAVRRYQSDREHRHLELQLAAGSLQGAQHHGLTTQFSYTWSHNLDEVTHYRGQLPQDSTNFKGDYGNSDFDTRNTFVGYVNYTVPNFRGP